MTKQADYSALAAWAEHDMRLAGDSTTALRGKDAAMKGREVLEAALGGAVAVERAVHGGRPALDPQARPGEHARSRTVRLTSDLNSRLEALAQAQQRRASEIMREALTDYLDSHRAS